MDSTPIALKYRNFSASYNSYGPGEELKMKEIFDSYKYDKKKHEEHKFALYEIHHPELLCGVHLQLFEKTITPQGKSLWNDLSKEETARWACGGQKYKGNIFGLNCFI